MAHLPRLLVLLFLGVHVSHGTPLPTSYDDSMCSESSSCGGFDIRYPFYLSNATQETPDNTSSYSCGYTDLKIFCQGKGKTEFPILQLKGDNYTILHISYDTYTIILGDTDVLLGNNCPRVRHNVSFDQGYWLNYTNSFHSLSFFFDCYSKPGDDMPPDLKNHQINCKGFSSNTPVGSGVSFVFISDSEEHNVSQEYQLADHCTQNFVAPVHEDALMKTIPLVSDYGAVIKRGFELEWIQQSTAHPRCHLCENSNGRCAYNEKKEFLGCLCSGGKVDDQDCHGSGANSSSTDSEKSHPTPCE